MKIDCTSRGHSTRLRFEIRVRVGVGDKDRDEYIFDVDKNTKKWTLGIMFGLRLDLHFAVWFSVLQNTFMKLLSACVRVRVRVVPGVAILLLVQVCARAMLG